ncbi:hypothetical protein HanXRQr2_Chr04g0174891 [Helianthus annuus]|uniref:Uncharacterized protein n=1 Tax=Helianthus annuus TaxID=4232 RepID=A0A9K3JAK3_HELAN|nr:hypothetical protein HanXRQr2_Chr04g0174891 [Helianthus annuus]KAJ0581622.1 hypothetical protein HanHA300_Chr04g0143181 [Helianthus annuus]KAJ0589633.1 hypothetical protein HanIR_Chr04g0188471 [Helianthus annuus]KAJ0597589.1 hypothetical protein HanHA89_Chr04g0156371 [Helianthus annuus]KAJ0758235.1 hypothetical protein HanLR1_Chr04g0148081 [Helianthus annuus]
MFKHDFMLIQYTPAIDTWSLLRRRPIDTYGDKVGILMKLN